MGWHNIASRFGVYCYRCAFAVDFGLWLVGLICCGRGWLVSVSLGFRFSRFWLDRLCCGGLLCQVRICLGCDTSCGVGII